ncbi:SagB family peptide dehydrogenase [Streptomyces sp. NPDC005408]|uniref:SagB family peptide dehydrogenase n=1 Tax=Streptomyces sp. NPDC005408 TaxID=3155341 RepID=UPI0033A03A29
MTTAPTRTITETVLRLRPGARITEAALPSDGIRAAVAALGTGDRTTGELAAAVTALDGELGLLRWQMFLRRLEGGGLVERAIRVAGEPHARLRVIGQGPLPASPALAGAVKLSRFAVAAPADGGVLSVRAPGSHLAVELAPQAVALLGALTSWTAPDGLDFPAPAEVLGLFAAAGLLAPGGPDHDEETADPRLATWQSEDRWIHARTRGPKTVAGYGGTYRNRDRFAPEPAARPSFPVRRVAPATPDLGDIARRDPSLTEVLEGRTSVREHDHDAPITVDQLGELLYRTLRMRSTFTGSDGQELADRPCPSGGAVHELEVYPLVTHCAGLDAGLWHYATDRHELELVAEPGPRTQALVSAARDGSLMATDPQVLLLVTARFGRVMWKYETVAYPLILKHVGVLYQTLYLVGTAMGLGVCGLGGGDAGDFAAASGIDPLIEGSVGELVLGSRPVTLRHSAGVPRGHEEGHRP